MPKKTASSKQKSYNEGSSNSGSSSGATSGMSEASSAVSSAVSDSSSEKSSAVQPVKTQSRSVKTAVSKDSPSTASEASEASATTTSGSESSYQPSKNARTRNGKPTQVRVQDASPGSSVASSPVSTSSESPSPKKSTKNQNETLKPPPKKSSSKKQVQKFNEESGSESDISDDSILSLSDPRLSKKPPSSATSQIKSSAGVKAHADVKIETLAISASGRSMPSATSSRRSDDSQSLVLTPDGHQAVVIMASGKDVPLASSDEELSEGGRWKVMKKHGKSAAVKVETAPSGKSKPANASSKKQKEEVQEAATPKRKVFTSTKQATPASATSSSSNGSSNTDSSDSVSSSLIESIRQKQALERKRNMEKPAASEAKVRAAELDDEEDDDEPLHAVLAKSDSNAPIGASAMFQPQQQMQQQGYYPQQQPQQYPGMMYPQQMMPGMVPGMPPMAAGYAMPMQGFYPPQMPQQPQMAMYNGVPQQQQQQQYFEPDDLTPFDSVSNAPSGGRIIQQAGQFQQYAASMPIYAQAAPQTAAMYQQRPGQVVSPPQPQYLQQQQQQQQVQQAYQMQMMQMQQQQQQQQMMMQNNSRKGGAANMPDWVNEHKPKIGGEGTLMEQVKRGRELPNGNAQMNLIENIQYDPKKGQVPMMNRPQQQQQQFQPGMPGIQPGMQQGYYGMQPGMMQPGMPVGAQGYGGQMMNGYPQQYQQNGP